ncbi:MAG: hypothetical protein RIR55_1776 [Bacteroidota bacterium]
MHLLIVAPKKLTMPSSILEAMVVDIIKNCKQNKDLSIVIVGFHGFENRIKEIEGVNHITFIAKKEAAIMVKQVKDARVLHFGDNLNWAQNIPVYFMPLALPSDLNNLSFLNRFLFKKVFNNYLKKASNIIATNDWAYASLQQNHVEFLHKMVQVSIPLNAPNALEWTTLSAAKEEIANGNNYFLYFAPLERFVPILKEFSVFKKWQQTTMNLVIMLQNQQEVDKAMILLKGYKFISDIQVYCIEDIDDEWFAASYAILWEGVSWFTSTWIIKSIQYDIPLLFDDKISLTTTWQKAGEVISFSDEQVLSNHFKLYYKDEIYRQARARMGKEWLDLINQPSEGKELFNNIVLSHIK